MNARTIGRVLLDAVAVALIAVALLMLSGRLVVQPVLSGSMTGYAGRGDLVVGAASNTRTLQVGDVILFAPPAPWSTPGDRPVAHRIASVDTVDGRLVATTKGDANPQPDPWTLDLANTRTAQVRLVLPSVGWPFIRLHLLATPAGRMTAGLTLMATGGVLLMLGRRRQRRSDEPWPPVFEGEALELRLQLVQERHLAEPPAPAASRFRPAPIPPAKPAHGPLIPRQRQWSPEEALSHFPFE